MMLLVTINEVRRTNNSFAHCKCKGAKTSACRIDCRYCSVACVLQKDHVNKYKEEAIKKYELRCCLRKDYLIRLHVTWIIYL